MFAGVAGRQKKVHRGGGRKVIVGVVAKAGSTYYIDRRRKGGGVYRGVHRKRGGGFNQRWKLDTLVINVSSERASTYCLLRKAIPSLSQFWGTSCMDCLCSVRQGYCR